MLSLNDVNTGLHWVLIQSVDNETTYNLGLVVKLAKEAFFTISRHS